MRLVNSTVIVFHKSCIMPSSLGCWLHLANSCPVVKDKSGFACHPIFWQDMTAHTVHHFLTECVLIVDQIEHVVVDYKILVVVITHTSGVVRREYYGTWRRCTAKIFVLPVEVNIVVVLLLIRAVDTSVVGRMKQTTSDVVNLVCYGIRVLVPEEIRARAVDRDILEKYDRARAFISVR
jgi:hypothetical protein